jgi:glutamine amidotransferase
LQAGTTLNRKYRDNPDGEDSEDRDVGLSGEHHGKHLIVASEPSTYKEEDWNVIGRNQYLMADVDGQFVVKDIPYESEWNAEYS